MSNETPSRDAVPGWGQPGPEPQPDAPTAPWPAPPEPAATPWPAEADAPADAPTAPWASTPEPTPPAPATPPGTWGAPPQPGPQQAPAPQQQPAAPGTWGAPAPAQQQQPPAPGGWGAPPAQQQPGWGGAPQQQPPQQPAPQQQPPGGWGAPPPQGGWAPGGPGAPGGPPVGWAPAPVKSGGNGCLKGCLIVGAIGFVLVVIAIIGLVFAAGKLTEGMVNPDGSLKSCTLISDQDLSDALGTNAQALPLAGIWDATMGNILDKRVLKDAEDCWIAVGSGVTSSATAAAATGRLAVSNGGDASGAFRQEKETANRGGYLGSDVSGLGDEAFCTDPSAIDSAGVLARSGSRLVYVSLVTADPTGGSDACAAAQEVARKLLR